MEGVVAARGMADAASLLCRRYTIQATNVPFLGRGKQCNELLEYLDRRFARARADLATAMLNRMEHLAEPSGSIAIVSPQNWHVLGNYKLFRQDLLEHLTLNLFCDLGPAAFRDMNWWAARTALTIISNCKPVLSESSSFSLHDHRVEDEKQYLARSAALSALLQEDQRKNPNSRLVAEKIDTSSLLDRFCQSRQGIKTGDDDALRRNFWELPQLTAGWRFLQGSPDGISTFSELTDIVWWGKNGEKLARLQGMQSYGKIGCAIGQMNQLPATLYLGGPYDSNMTALTLADGSMLPALWAYVSSDEFRKNIRKIEPGVKVNNGAFLKIPFDRTFWDGEVQGRFGGMPPEPHSDDATQWLFHGYAPSSELGKALHVTLARLCGYRWPAELDKAMHLSKDARELIEKAEKLPNGDSDGLLGVPSVGGEAALAERMRGYLATSYGVEWSDMLERRLVAEADVGIEKKSPQDVSLEGWLRDRAFRQHCTIFHQRPFLWQIWDGLQDGFSVFVHYHRFDQAALRKLTYTVLGDWLARAKDEKNELRYEKASELQQKLEKILEGEKPYDIFVRWKSLAEQPIGWDPDLDDGVRMNIRPFVEAGILRDTPRIKWTKDRGSDVSAAPWYQLGLRYDGKAGDRINEHHTTLAEKHAARIKVKKRTAGGDT